jgi:hypothetical protein
VSQPLNSLRPKTGQLQFGQLVWRKIIFIFIFILDECTTYFTSFLGTPSMSNSNFVWACGEVLFKMGFKFIFLVFFEELLHATTMWLKFPKGLKSRVLRKKFVLPMKSQLFTSSFFCSWFCMMSSSTWPLWSKCEFLIFFPRNFTRSIVLKFWVDALSTKIVLAHS